VKSVFHYLGGSDRFAATVQPVTPPRRLLRTEADLDKWVAEVRKAVLAKLRNGPVQL